MGLMKGDTRSLDYVSCVDGVSISALQNVSPQDLRILFAETSKRLVIERCPL